MWLHTWPAWQVPEPRHRPDSWMYVHLAIEPASALVMPFD